MNISRLEIPLGSATPVLDGVCDDPEYQGASLSLEPYGSGGQGNVKLMRTSEALWACFGGLLQSPYSTGYAGLRIDVYNSRDSLAQTDDHGFFASEDGTPFTRAGDNLDGFNEPGPGGLSAQVSSAADPYWNAELRIDRDVLGGWDHPVGITLEQYRQLSWISSQRLNWPFDSVYNAPDTWAWTILGDLPANMQLTPETASAGDPTFTLTINGENFQDGSVVSWMATVLPTTYYNAEQLTAIVDNNLIATSKYALLTVAIPIC